MRTLTSIRKGLVRRARIKWYSLGNQVECCYCGWTGTQFLPAGSNQAPNRLCPRCGSLERYRQLYLYLESLGLSKGSTSLRVLEIAPKPCFRRYCQSLPHVTYISSDLTSAEAMVLSDLTRMGLADESFDIIVCLHVLEHILDDRAALAEIRRLLKPSGLGLIMVPIKGEKTFEDPSVLPIDYERVYGQADHVRLCGMDYRERIEEVAGLQVSIVDMVLYFDATTLRRFALYGDDRILFLVRNQHSALPASL